MNAHHAPMSKIFALPLRLGRGTDNDAPIFDRSGELCAECVDDDCDERASAVIRAVNSYDEMLTSLKEISEMFMARPDMVRALQPLIGFAEKATFERAAAAIAKAEGR